MVIFNPKLFNPVYWHLRPLLADEKIRYIFLEGGSSASKTFTICQAIVHHIMHTGTNAVVFRRFHVHIKDSIYASFRSAIVKMKLESYFIFQNDLIKCRSNGARIVFKGLDNEENIKGIEDFDIVYNNEWNQFLESHWKQQRKRLRGRPNQKFICDWNPVSARMWNYEKWIDLEKWEELPLRLPNAPSKYSQLNHEYAFKRINSTGNSVNIKITYRDNFWIVGHPSGKGGFLDVETIRDFNIDRERDSAQYRVYANGERGVIKTGGEFWKQFNIDRDSGAVKYMGGPIHATIDGNVTPYVTICLWQVIGSEISQFAELICKSPDNNAPKAASKLIRYLESISFNEMLFIYGDPSLNSRSIVDEDGKSFFQKFLAEIERAAFRYIDRVGKSAPSISMSGAFINAIYENNILGYKILIGDNCKYSVDDYTTVKEAPDGTMAKQTVKDPDTLVTYQPYGHISDTKRYFIVQLLKDQYEEWAKRHKKRLMASHFPGNR